MQLDPYPAASKPGVPTESQTGRGDPNAPYSRAVRQDVAGKKCRRGGMVDATDLKSVVGQPAWGFESPRRHSNLLIYSKL